MLLQCLLGQLPGQLRADGQDTPLVGHWVRGQHLLVELGLHNQSTVRPFGKVTTWKRVEVNTVASTYDGSLLNSGYIGASCFVLCREVKVNSNAKHSSRRHMVSFVERL